MRARRPLALTLLAAATFLAAPATAQAADKIGPTGAAARVDVNGTSSDAFVQYHGRLFVESGKNKNSRRSEEYRWGGTSCGSKTLGPEMVQLLLDAVRDNLTIRPSYKPGQGSTKCLVGFSVR